MRRVGAVTLAKVSSERNALEAFIAAAVKTAFQSQVAGRQALAESGGSISRSGSEAGGWPHLRVDYATRGFTLPYSLGCAALGVPADRARSAFCCFGGRG